MSKNKNAGIKDYPSIWVERILANLKNKENLRKIVNKIYEEGFEDGANNG